MTKIIALFDGQNLFHMVRLAFGGVSPDVNPHKLSHLICGNYGWHLAATRYYTGIHKSQVNPVLNSAKQAHLSKMQAIGTVTFARKLQYHKGIGREKGIDMRIALDAINIVHTKSADIILLFSQDQDFVELAEEIRTLNRIYGASVKIASAFPDAPTLRGIYKTDWLKYSKADYLASLF